MHNCTLVSALRVCHTKGAESSLSVTLSELACRSFEGAIAAMGAPLVGLIAKNLFRFPADSSTYDCVRGLPSQSGTDWGELSTKADALGNAMLVCMLVPWILCLIIYSGLHWTYPKDRRRCAASMRLEQQQQQQHAERQDLVC